mmetsp:Transcript_14769/g.44479  ORF Transcript_14769/g.44479 Transcript_14769/m.44479 type:complete len:186 (-) Transcript_14769:255-812(-)
MSLPRRIVKETQRLLQDPVTGISATPYEDNLRYFRVMICGPEDTPYAGGQFMLELFLPTDYPMAPPKVRSPPQAPPPMEARCRCCRLLTRSPPGSSPLQVRFLTRIYHPNVDKLGRICLDILKDKWSPALQIRTVLLSIQALLSAPNPDDPLDNDIAALWTADEEQAHVNAREWTERYAKENAAS